MSVRATQCDLCKHFEGFVDKNLRCPAFPDGIPVSVYDGATPHHVVVEGQSGRVVFEPNPNADAEMVEAVRQRQSGAIGDEDDG